MSDTSYGVLQWNEGTSVAGFVPKPYTTIVEDVEYRLKNALGTDIDLSSSSPLKQFVDAMAYELYYVWQALENVYYSSYIDYAENTALDNIGSVFGLIRYSEGAASGTIRLYRGINGSTGEYITGVVTIPNGTVFVGKTSGLTYKTTTDYTLAEYPVGLYIDVTVTCTTPGSVGNCVGENTTTSTTDGAVCRIYADTTNQYISKIEQVVQITAFTGSSITSGDLITLRLYRKAGVTGQILITRYAAQVSDTTKSYNDIITAISTYNASITDTSERAFCMFFRNDTINECWYDPVVDTKNTDKFLYFYPGSDTNELSRYIMFVPTSGNVIMDSDEDYIDVECRYVWKDSESMTIYDTILPTQASRTKTDGGAINTMSSKITGIGLVTQTADITNGTDDETDAEFRSRIKTYETNTTGTASSIENYVKTLPFVKGCKVVDRTEVVNSVTLHYADVMVSRTDYDDWLKIGDPSTDTSLITTINARTQQIQNIINAVKPAGMKVTINPVPTNSFKVQVIIEFANISESLVVTNVKAAIKSYFDSLEIDDPVECGKIIDAVYSTEGVTRITQTFLVTNLLTSVTKAKLLDVFTVESGNQACIDESDIIVSVSYPVA